MASNYTATTGATWIPNQRHHLPPYRWPYETSASSLFVRIRDGTREMEGEWQFRVWSSIAKGQVQINACLKPETTILPYGRYYYSINIVNVVQEEVASHKGFVTKDCTMTLMEAYEIFNLTYIAKNHLNLDTVQDNYRASVRFTIELSSFDDNPKSFQSQWQMLNEGILTDVLIKTKEQDYPCHKIILAAESEYFKVMFQSDMIEKTTNVVNWVNVFDGATVKAFLYFIYTGLRPLDLEDIQYSLIEMAELCLLPKLKRMCAENMELSLSEANANMVLETAEKFGLMGLKKAGEMFAELDGAGHTKENSELEDQQKRNKVIEWKKYKENWWTSLSKVIKDFRSNDQVSILPAKFKF